MITVGLTGGIGSGKSTVAAFFEDLGVPVYHSDARAKILMETDPRLRDGLIGLLGPETYREGQLDRAWVASRIFKDKALLEAVNALVHPAVRQDFLHWSEDQDSPYVLQEAAILFENGGYQNMDRMILVTAPETERLKRVVARDGAAEAAVRSRMKHQWPDARKRALADFEIRNDSLPHTRQQVGEIHRELLELSGSAGLSEC